MKNFRPLTFFNLILNRKFEYFFALLIFLNFQIGFGHSKLPICENELCNAGFLKESTFCLKNFDDEILIGEFLITKAICNSNSNVLLNNGVYYLKIISGENSELIKIIIQH